jgi:hypothetical protein
MRATEQEIRETSMNGNWMRRTSMLMTVMVLALASAEVSAQVNLTGSWTMSVTTDAGGTTTPSLTLQQNGNALTGHYASETLGEADVTGTVEGNQVTINFTVDLQGQEVPVTYAATVGADGTLTGTIDLAGGLATGTFTARKTQ